MQIEKKPPVWPYLAALVSLLLLCLAAPQYWLRHTSSIESAADVTPRAMPHRESASAQRPMPSRHEPYDLLAELDRLPLLPAAPAENPTLVLVPPRTIAEPGPAERVAEELPPPPSQVVFVEPPAEPPSPVALANEATLDDVFLGFDTAGVLHDLGRRVAGWTSRHLEVPIPEFVKRPAAGAASAPEQVTINSPPALRGPVQVQSATERLAMVPRRNDRLPDLKVPKLTLPSDDESPIPTDTDAAQPSPWQTPVALLNRLERLAEQPLARGWADDVLREVDQLTVATGAGPETFNERLAKLIGLAADARELAGSIGDERLQNEVLRAHYGLVRRLDVWTVLNELDGDARQLPTVRVDGTQKLQSALRELTEITQGSERGAEWEDYLLIEPVARLADTPARLSARRRRELAREILARISSSRLDAAQREFVRSEPVAALGDELRYWAAEEVDVAALHADLEKFEVRPQPRLARRIAEEQQRLAWSPDPLKQSLADHIEGHYRNANLRLAVTGDLLNRMIEERERRERRRVRERIVGTPVRGLADTRTIAFLRLLPDERYARIGLEATGQVASNTVADGGSAQLQSRGNSEFRARKLIVAQTERVMTWPAVANAHSRSRLVDLRTDYDGIPLLGAIVRSVAQDEYEANRGRARAEVEFKLARQAMQQLDEQGASLVEKLQERIDSTHQKLDEFGVRAETIELRTSAQRIVGRWRIAADDQLAGHTPRMRAPSDSLASLQLHESVLSNMAQSLNLDGRRLTAPELRDLVREKFPDAEIDDSEKAPEDTLFHFSDENAVEVYFKDGQMDLTLSLAEVVHDRRPTRRFKVHAYYRPVIEGIEVKLVRDGALGIEGRIRTSDRARLHNMFNKVLPDDREIPIIDLDEPDSPQLTGLMITQMVLEDGWLGVAIGPKSPDRTVQRYRSLR